MNPCTCPFSLGDLLAIAAVFEVRQQRHGAGQAIAAKAREHARLHEHEVKRDED